MPKTVWQNRATGALFASPEVALEKTKDLMKRGVYEYDEGYWILPERDGIVVILYKKTYESHWSIFFQLNLTEIVE